MRFFVQLLATLNLILLFPLDGLSRDADIGQGEAQGRYVELWTRSSGEYANGGSPDRRLLRELDLEKQNLATVQMQDAQYDERLVYKGIFLRDIVESYQPETALDSLILHFENGVQIPMILTDVRSSDVFLARYLRVGRTWSTELPELAKHDPSFRYKDPRPITFGGNKIVVKSLRHPLVRSRYFSPWSHASSLKGIEFINQDAYDRQFASRKGTERGKEVFQARCQFCHGVNKVGATFGWDFIDPLPVWQLKSSAHIYNKLKYPYHDAFERGLLMPTQTDISEEEVKALWSWLKAVHKTGVKAYRP